MGGGGAPCAPKGAERDVQAATAASKIHSLAPRSGERVRERGVARLFHALLLLCAILPFTRCTSIEDDPSYLRVTLTASPRDLDPRIGGDEVSQRIQQLVFSSLFVLDAQLRVVPDVATGLESPDPLTYIVHLRHGVTFQDGSPFTAADVVYTYRSFLDPSFISAKRGAYRSVTAIDAIDPYTVRFRLKEPFGSFPVQLVLGIIKAGATDVSAHPVGTGPYAFVRAMADDRVVLSRYDGYFGGAAQNPGIVLKVVPDDTMRGLELRKGTIDFVVNDMSPDIVRDLEKSGRVRVTSGPGCDYAYVAFNMRDPILSNVRVRQALAYAVDRQAIVDYLRRGLATPAAGMLPRVSWAYDATLPEYLHDPARAKALLDAAGYPDPDGDGPRPRFTLTLKSSNVEFTRLQCAVLQQNWKQIGVDVALRSSEQATFLTDIGRGNFQMATAQWAGGALADPDILRRVFASTQMPPVGFNRGHFQDPQVDALIARATQSTDDAERRALYGQVQARIAEQVPYISLWHKTNVVVAQPDIEGVTVSPSMDFAFIRRLRRVTPAADAPRAAQ
jgi:peptide/nickel transport system substrate-binding protein